MDKQIFIREAAEMLDRMPATLRSWERYGWLPAELLPSRNERGWRYWTPDQVKRLGEWMLSNDMRPGKGLPHYRPTPAQVSSHMAGQRRPRARRPAPAVT